MDVPEPQSESWGVTGILNFSPICGAWKDARQFYLGKIAAMPRALVQALPVLSCRCCREGDAIVQSWEWHSLLRRELWENFLWLLGLSCVAVMAIVIPCDAWWASLHFAWGMRRDVLRLQSGLPVNVVCGSVGKGKITESVQMWVGFFFLHSLGIDSLGEKRINELARLLRDCSHICSQKILVFNEMHVRNSLLSVKYVAKIYIFNFYFFSHWKIQQFCGGISRLSSIGNTIFWQEANLS